MNENNHELSHIDELELHTESLLEHINNTKTMNAQLRETNTRLQEELNNLRDQNQHTISRVKNMLSRLKTLEGQT